MPGLLGKKFPAPIGAYYEATRLSWNLWRGVLTDIFVASPMWPFYVGGLVIAYGINSAATAMMQSDEYKNDPRNPYAKTAEQKEQ